MKLVLIEWIDSHRRQSSEWKQLSSLEDEATPLRCKSVGWLLSDFDGGKVIVPHVSGSAAYKGDDREPFGLGEISIPDVAILRMVVLRKG